MLSRLIPSPSSSPPARRKRGGWAFAAAAATTLTPSPLALTTATFAPAVTVSDNAVLTPATLAIVWTGFAPVVTAGNNQTVTPSPLALTVTGFAPTVSATASTTVTPSPAALALTGFAPAIATTSSGGGGHPFRSSLISGTHGGRSMDPRLAETVYLDFVTSSSSGAAADADALPTAEVFEDATDTAVLAPTVVKRAGKTGNYRVPVACTTANGFETGKSYNVLASATVGGVAAKAVIGRFALRPAESENAAAVVAALSGRAVTVASPVASTGDITIIRGDDYRTRDGRALTFTDSGGTWPGLTGATVSLTINGDTFAGTVTGVASVSVELTAAQTAVMVRTTLTQTTVPYYLRIVDTHTDVITTVRGRARIKDPGDL